MKDNIDKLMAEALVECGHAKPFGNEGWLIMDGHNNKYSRSAYEQAIDPFADTLEGRKQADALEDYFEQRPDLWDLWNSYSRPYVYDVGESIREWRLDRIKWCFEQLAEKSHD